jgi:hypothetical protein
MKRMMIAAMLLLGTVSVFAADEKCEVVSVKMKMEEKREVETCTASATGSIMLFGSGIKVECTATSDKGCKEAVRQARICVSDFIKSLLSWE